MKFNWWSFSKFAIDLRSLTKVEMYILTRIVWAIRFLNFLILTCNSLILRFWLKLSSEIKRFSNHWCSRIRSRDRRCHSDISLFRLIESNSFRSCIVAWFVWTRFSLLLSVTNLCTKHFYLHIDDLSWNILNIDRTLWSCRSIIVIILRLIFSRFCWA